MHLDLETCTALKAAGMPWEPKQGDWFYCWPLETPHLYISLDSREDVPNAITFIPRLDDLLVLIEAEGWKWTIGQQPNGGIRILVWCGKEDQIYFVPSPVQAAAQVYLWVLHTKNKEG